MYMFSMGSLKRRINRKNSNAEFLFKKYKYVLSVYYYVIGSNIFILLNFKG